MGPFVDGGFDEAFRFAVGARRVGSGATVLESELVAGVGEAMGLVARAVIGEDASRNDAKPAEPAHGGSQEVRRTAFGLVRIHGREGEPGVVIDGDVQELGADAFDPISHLEAPRLQPWPSQPCQQNRGFSPWDMPPIIFQNLRHLDRRPAGPQWGETPVFFIFATPHSVER